MANMKWKVLESAYVSKYQYFTARKDKCEMPDGKIVDEYYVVELPPSVCAVALTENEEVLMVKQYRHPLREVILELPGGFVDKGEKPGEAMLRELREETGYAFSSVKELGKVAANPGVLDNYTYLFLAEGGKFAGTQQLDKNEEILVTKIPLQELVTLFLDNKIIQALHTNCIFYALRTLGKI